MTTNHQPSVTKADELQRRLAEFGDPLDPVPAPPKEKP